MKRDSLLVFIITAIITAVCFAPRAAHAAKMLVTWIPPTQNSDGSPLTDLIGYRVEWGTCNADGSFGTYQAGINVADPTATRAYIYPTGIAKVCAHVFSINSHNVLSPASNTGSSPAPIQLSQPTH